MEIDGDLRLDSEREEEGEGEGEKGRVLFLRLSLDNLLFCLSPPDSLDEFYMRWTAQMQR